MKRILSLMMTFSLALSLAACGGTDNETQTPPTAPPPSVPESSAPAAPSADPSGDPTAEPSASGDSNILVAYFSLAGEQYEVGVIEKGNTEIVAEMIAEAIGADLFSIQPVTPYPTTYDGLLEVSQQESPEAPPAIAETVADMEQYDTVFIGYPIWWGDIPAIVAGFLESYDFSGKTVIPFSTHAGSGMGQTQGTVESLATGADVLDGLAIRGQTAQNDPDTAKEDVTAWLEELGLLPQA